MDGIWMQENVRKKQTQVFQVIKKLKEIVRRCKEIVIGLLREVWNDEFWGLSLLQKMRCTTANGAHTRLQPAQASWPQPQPLRFRHRSTDTGCHRYCRWTGHYCSWYSMEPVLGNAACAPRRLDHQFLSTKNPQSSTKAALVTINSSFFLNCQ